MLVRKTEFFNVIECDNCGKVVSISPDRDTPYDWQWLPDEGKHYCSHECRPSYKGEFTVIRWRNSD